MRPFTQTSHWMATPSKSRNTCLPRGLRGERELFAVPMHVAVRPRAPVRNAATAASRQPESSNPGSSGLRRIPRQQLPIAVQIKDPASGLREPDLHFTGAPGQLHLRRARRQSATHCAPSSFFRRLRRSYRHTTGSGRSAAEPRLPARCLSPHRGGRLPRIGRAPGPAHLRLHCASTAAAFVATRPNVPCAVSHRDQIDRVRPAHFDGETPEMRAAVEPGFRCGSSRLMFVQRSPALNSPAPAWNRSATSLPWP